MKSVQNFLLSIKNVQSKLRIITELEKRDGAQPRMGLMHRNGKLEIVAIY